MTKKNSKKKNKRSDATFASGWKKAHQFQFFFLFVI